MLIHEIQKQEEGAKIKELENGKKIQSMICEAAESSVGFSRMHNNNRPENKEVENLSRKQKEIRLKINSCKVTEIR